MRPAVRPCRIAALCLMIIVFETASAEAGGDKGRWIEAAARTAREWHLDGLNWFQVNKEIDWRLLWREFPCSVLTLRRLGSSGQSRLRDWIRWKVR